MERRDGQHAERDIFNIGEIQGNVIVQNSVEVSRPRNEKTLLRAVRGEVEARLAHSLHNAVFLTLGKEARQEQVKPFWSGEIKIDINAKTPIPEDMSIAEVFNSPEVGGKLLILGQPGVGKTTTLLNLAQALLEKAESDPNYPIPVLLNLSRWRDKNQPIQDWLAMELHSKHHGDRREWNQWINNRIILPLLDGLDEVNPEQQEYCINRINEFMHSDLASIYIVVCSRMADYETHKTKLQLNGAIYLQVLSDGQIQKYLKKIERQGLWKFLSQSPESLDLLRTSLLLNMAILAYPQPNEEQWRELETSKDKIHYLLAAYIRTMLHRPLENHAYGKRKIPTAQQTYKWLSWLAKKMSADSQTEFLIEEMQPSLLTDNQYREYRLIFTLILGLMGLVLGLTRFIAGTPESIRNIIYLLFEVTFWVSLVTGRYNIPTKRIHQTIFPVEVVKFSWVTFLKTALTMGLALGIIFVIIFKSIIIMVSGILLGLLLGVLFGILAGSQEEDLEVKAIPNQGIKRSRRNYLLHALAMGSPIAFIVVLEMINSKSIDNLFLKIVFIIFFGLSFALRFGGNASIQHFILRLIIYQSKHIPWNYAQFLNYCTERLLLERVGGRYRFIHRLLQDHFSQMSEGIEN